MFKKVICFVLMIGIVLSMSACGKNTLVTIDQIKNDVEAHEQIQDCYSSNFVLLDGYTIDKLTISKRQTNLDEKEDIIYCTSTVKNRYFEVILSIKIIYNYYDDGGWLLDELEILEKQTTPINEPNSELIAEFYNDKLNDDSNTDILFVDEMSNQYWFDKTISVEKTSFKDDEAVINVLYSEKMYKLYGDIALKFHPENGWEISHIYEFTDSNEEYIKINRVESDYTQALGKFYCKSGYYKGATLDIIKIDENSIEYNLIIPSDLESEYIYSPGHRTTDFNPLHGTVITEYTYNGVDIPFSHFTYDPNNDSWNNGAKIDFHFTR